jgi:hypothetical protein
VRMFGSLPAALQAAGVIDGADHPSAVRAW